jgi:cell division protein FtsN
LDRDENQDELEYNDGLGDLLREKEKLEFSWGKTAVVLGVVIVLIFIGLTFLFNVGKNIVTETETSGTEIVDTVTIEEKNDDLVELLNEQTNDDSNIPHLEPRAAEVKETLSPIVVKSKKDDVMSPTTSLPLRYKLIAGTFRSKTNASNMISSLNKKGIDAFVTSIDSNGKSLFRVQAGAYATREAAKEQKLRLSKHEIDSYILTIE